MEKVIIIAGMLISGSINTLTKKIQNDSKAKGVENSKHEFEHPWFQTAVMFAGEFVCLILFMAITWYKNRQDRLQTANAQLQDDAPLISAQSQPQRSKWSLLLFLFPTVCDILGTSFGGIGLLWVSASVWQMMRGTIIIFSGILSWLFLKRKMLPYRWLGICITASGLGVVGFSSFLGDSSGSDDHLLIIGLIFIIAGQFCNAVQMIIEEKFLKDKNFPPLQVVGMEGFYGLLLMCGAILPVMYYIPGSNQGSYENSWDALLMMSQNGVLTAMVLIYLCSIAFYNFFGLSVTKKLTTVHRTLIDALRTICVWGMDLVIYYFIDKEYGESWNDYSWVQLIGFGLLVLGTLTYNGVLKYPFLEYDQPATNASSGNSEALKTQRFLQERKPLLSQDKEDNA